MNPDLLSANVSMALMAVVGLSLLAHLAKLTGPRRALHAVHAVLAVGLLYFFGNAAFGWAFLPRPALFALYAAIALAVAATAGLRIARKGHAGFPWGVTLIEAASISYVFAPYAYWKPAISALLLLYFLLEFFRWLKGTEEAVAAALQNKDGRPPLYPPKRVRGLREFAHAGVTAGLVYVFAMGTVRAPVAEPPSQEGASATQAEPEPPPPQAANEAPKAEGETERSPTGAQTEAEQTPPAPAPAAPPPAPAAPAPVEQYTAAAGDTLKSVAKKLYGKPEKWRDLAKANPGLKPGAKLKAGQIVRLPVPPAR